MTQGTLFAERKSLPAIDAKDITVRRHGGNAESKKAHERIKQGKAETRLRILGHIKQLGTEGATTDEIAAWMNVPPNAISGRMTELKKLGALTATSQTRRTRSGCAARVFVATESLHAI